MCFCCILIDQSLPSPKSLIQSFRELNTSDEHKEAIIQRVFDKLTDEQKETYGSELFGELYNEFLRNT
jgi:hypothetical protein